MTQSKFVAALRRQMPRLLRYSKSLKMSAKKLIEEEPFHTPKSFDTASTDEQDS